MRELFGGACVASTLSVLVLYYSLVSSESADMEGMDRGVVREDSEQKRASGVQQLELEDAQEKIK